MADTSLTQTADHARQTAQVVALVERLFPGGLLSVVRGRTTDGAEEDAPDEANEEDLEEDFDLEDVVDMPCDRINIAGGGMVQVSYDADDETQAVEVTACHPGPFSGDILFFEPEDTDALSDEDLEELGNYLLQKEN